MLNKNNIRVLLSKMTEDMHSNVKKIKSAFGSLDYTDDENQSLLHILVDNIYDEEKCRYALQNIAKGFEWDKLEINDSKLKSIEVIGNVWELLGE